jgi:hypothetical protein
MRLVEFGVVVVVVRSNVGYGKHWRKKIKVFVKGL